MPIADILQACLFCGLLILLGKPLGRYIFRVMEGQPPSWIYRLLGGLETWIWKGAGIDPKEEMTWRRYATLFLSLNALGLGFLYLLQRVQGILPFNPAEMKAVAPPLAWNTAMSFASNTNWQAYSGEQTMSYLTQALGLNVQNFVSAASGIAILFAVFRGLSRKQSGTLGNFAVDLSRATLYILLPLSLLLSLALVSQGVVQTWGGPVKAEVLHPFKNEKGELVREQVLARGPAASQVAIKQLGTNGGGFFNTNSAHPFENPTPLSGFLQLLAILLLPVSLCFSFGEAVGDRRQGWAIFATMALLFVLAWAGMVASEGGSDPRGAAWGLDQRTTAEQSGGWMEGKEVRFGLFQSTLWATATTAASNGSVNSMHDSYRPLGGMITMLLMLVGEVVFGGVGSGLYGILAFVILAVFVGGLMVGRTPEYLGKKIEPFEMKMVSFAILLPSAAVLLGLMIAVLSSEGHKALSNPGPHGFSELLYAFASAGNNNGSAFAGLNADQPLLHTLLGLAMGVGRYGVAIALLALAGSLGAKKTLPLSAGTLSTHTPLFVIFLAFVILLVGALTFFPALALGPLAEIFS